MQQFRHRLYIAALSAGIGCGSVLAADYPTEQDYLQEFPIVLSASRLSQPLSETPNAVTVIDRGMIVASGARNIADVFKLVPSMYVGYENGHTPIVSYRGITDAYARRMQVLVDGRSIYLPIFGHVDWAELPLDIGDIDRIEVVRGPSAASHGSNSVQGVINIRLIMSGSTPSYQQFSVALSKALAENRAEVVIAESDAGTNRQPARSVKTDLVVAVGMKATELAITDSDVPLLSVIVPKISYEALLERYPSRYPPKAVSAIYLDQPWGRQLNFIRALLPGHNIVGVLYSPDFSIILPRLPRGMSLNAKSVRSTESLFEALESILNGSDVLLAIPDSEIYSSNNVRNILLTSYRYKVPLIGISQAYVNAGALGAVFSTPEQIAMQTAETIIAFAKNYSGPRI